MSQVVAGYSQEASTSPVWKGVFCIQEYKVTETTQLCMPHYYHPYKITRSRGTAQSSIVRWSCSSYCCTSPYLDQGCICFWTHGGKMKQIPASSRGIFTWDYPFPSIMNRLVVFILFRNIHIVNSFRQCVEIVTTQAYLPVLYSKITDLFKEGLSYLVEEWLRVTGTLSITGLLLIGQKCPFHSHSPRYTKCGLVRRSHLLSVSA